MKITFRIGLAFLTLIIPAIINAQAPADSHVRSSPAYAEVLLRTVELKAELESLIEDYTETNPKIVDLRLEISALEKASTRLFAIKPLQAGKLTLALGRLLVQKAALDAEITRLAQTQTSTSNQLKRARKRADIYEEAIRNIIS